MLKVRRIVRDYSEAGSVNSLLAVCGFVDEHAFLTKAGHIGLVYRLAGSDFECLDRRQRRDVVHHACTDRDPATLGVMCRVADEVEQCVLE